MLTCVVGNRTARSPGGSVKMIRVVYKKAFGLRLLGGRIRAFRHDEDGAIMLFVVIMFLMMVVVSGGAVDFMRQETERARLQDSLDRGVLAAAAFSQGLGAEDTVGSYLVSSRVPNRVIVNVSTDASTYSRQVTAQASYDLNTFFLKIIGINNLAVVAHSAATQGRNNLEISISLDITPSMTQNNKMANLKVAAHQFIDAILTDDSKDVTSVTLIPFGGQTSPGANVFNKFNVTKLHNYSNCIAFLDSDFNSIGLSTSAPRTQSQHFRYTSQYGPTNWCPAEDSSMVPLSNSAADLHARITGMGVHGWTGIQNGLKWGTIMLDPASQGLVSSLIIDGAVPAGFSGRPAVFSDTRTLKFAVVMTDGEITQQYGVTASSYDTIAERVYWASNTLGSANRVTLTTQPNALNQLLRLCAATKAAGITLFTIGFEVDDVSAATLETCATSASHFYRVEGLEIADAFDSIARTIQTVKLVQ